MVTFRGERRCISFEEKNVTDVEHRQARDGLKQVISIAAAEGALEYAVGGF